MASNHDRRHFTRAHDGWPLALYEYAPAERSDLAPILLVHGTNCTHRIFDFGPQVGLARFLAQQGRHVFSLDLRGRGGSLPEGRVERARAFARGWSFDDFVNSDVPAALRYVCSVTGASSVDYVAHSLGAMVMFERLTRQPEPLLRRMVAIGGADGRALLPLPRPSELLRHRRVHINAGILLAPFASAARYSPLDWGARLAAPPWVPRSAYAALLNPANIDSHVLREYLQTSIAGLSARKWWSLASLMLSHARTPAPVLPYQAPTLFVVGAADKVVPPHRIQETAQRARHADWYELARDNGHIADYGHIDLVLGRHAHVEVFPRIATWLQDDVVTARQAA